jgi:hypothetical protein
MRTRFKLFAFLAVALALMVPTPAASQYVPSITIASSNRDSIFRSLRDELRGEGLTFKKLNGDRAVFELDTGRQPVRGEIVAVILETTVRFITVREGTRLEVTEVLSAAMPTGSERRTPDPREHWDAYVAVLERVKARLEAPAKVQPPAQ